MGFIKIAVSNILNNPYRDVEKFAYDEEKIKSLIESIMQTGFWNNTLVRPVDNLIGGLPATEALIEAELLKEGSGVFAVCEVELSYGHHRLEALRRSGVTHIELPIKALTDADMLRIMCNENKDGYGASALVLMESVGQVKADLNGHFIQFGNDEHEDYLADPIVYDKEGKSVIMYEKAKAWGKMKASGGVGADMIASFLGGSWNARHVKRANKALAGVEQNLMLVSEMEQVGSLSVLESLINNILFIRFGGASGTGEKVDAPEWPEHFKNEIIDTLINYCIPGLEVKKDKNGKVVYEKQDEGYEGEPVAKMVDKKLLTSTVLDRRRASMKANGSRPDLAETAKFEWKQRLFLDATMDQEEETLALEMVAAYIDFEGVEAADVAEMQVKVKDHYLLVADNLKAIAEGKEVATEVTDEINKLAEGAVADGTQVPSGENALDNFDVSEDEPVAQSYAKFCTLGSKFSDMATSVSALDADVTQDVLDVAESVMVSAVSILGNKRVMEIIKSIKAGPEAVEKAMTQPTADDAPDASTEVIDPDGGSDEF